MADHDLLRSQSNTVLKAIQDAGMRRDDFVWKEVRSGNSSVKTARQIVHETTGYYFTFDFFDGDMLSSASRIARFAPGSEHESEYAKCRSWDVMLQHFVDWLGYIYRETEPDLWSQEEDSQFKSEWLASNSPFTTSERKEIEQGLKRVEKFIIEHSEKSEESLKEIKDGVNLLIEASKKSGRRDWMLMFIGIFMSKLSDLLITPIHWQQAVKVLLSGAQRLISGDH